MVTSVLVKCAAAAAVITSLASPASAAIITIGASRDATIFENNVNNSNGAGPVVFAGTNGMDSPRRGLIDFDIAGSIPLGATIESVELTLYLGQVAGGADPTPRTIELHSLTADWGEGTTGLGSPIAGSGQGFPANAGDATWNERQFGSAAWGTPGGDFSAGASGTSLVGEVLNAPSQWLSTAALVSDVQSWLDNPASNFGWALVNADEATARDFRAFFSREADDPALRPQLTVTYTAATTSVPEPGSLTLVGLGLMGAASRLRRRR